MSSMATASQGSPIHPDGLGDEHHNVTLAMWEMLRKLSLAENIQPIVDPHVLIDEYQDLPASTVLNFVPQYNFPILCTSIIASIPAGATGTLIIGTRVIPLAGGLQPGLAQIQMVIFPQDTITLTSSTSGNLYLEIMGGRLMNDLWRRI